MQLFPSYNDPRYILPLLVSNLSLSIISYLVSHLSCLLFFYCTIVTSKNVVLFCFYISVSNRIVCLSFLYRYGHCHKSFSELSKDHSLGLPTYMLSLAVKYFLSQACFIHSNPCPNFSNFF